MTSNVAFIVAPFRSGSTAVWNACRSYEGVTAFYEPLHERLVSLVAQPREIDPTHEGVELDYFAEYRALDPAWLADAHHDVAPHAHGAMASSAARSALRAYVEGLAAVSDGPVVLQFNRACLAIPTLSTLWPAAPILAVTRPVEERLQSARAQESQSFDWYEACGMHWVDPGLRTKAAVAVPRVATTLARLSPNWFLEAARNVQARFEDDAGRYASAIFEHRTLRDDDLVARVGSILQLGSLGLPAVRS